MKNLLLFSALLFLCCCHSGEKKKGAFLENPPTDQQKETEHSDFANFFTAGDHNASIVAYKKPTAEQKRILKKFIQITVANPKMGGELDALLKSPETADLKHVTKTLGLSKRETALLFAIFKKQPILPQEGHISIFKDGNHISLKGKGDFSILDSLSINIDDSTVSFKGTQLYPSPIDSSFMTNKLLPRGERLETVHGFQGLNIILPPCFTLIVARLSNSGKTYIYLKTHLEIDVDNPFDQVYSIIIDQ